MLLIVHVNNLIVAVYRIDVISLMVIYTDAGASESADRIALHKSFIIIIFEINFFTVGSIWSGGLKARNIKNSLEWLEVRIVGFDEALVQHDCVITLQSDW